ncbi:MAG: hypothetical protein AB7E32_14770 [Desulfovibrio sp.]
MADIQELESLLERSSGTDVPVLLRAKEEAKRLVKADPSAANLSALDRASRMLKEAMGNQNNNQFTDIKSVLAYLQETRQIKQAKLYKDVRAGFLRRQKDGTFRRSDVDRYAASLKAVALPERQTDDLSALAKLEQEERVLNLQEKRKSVVFDREVKQGRYVLRDEIALELAGRAMALSVGLRSALQVAAPELIQAAGGDKNRADDLMREIEKHLDEALNEFSRPINFTVSIPETQEHVEE